MIDGGTTCGSTTLGWRLHKENNLAAIRAATPFFSSFIYNLAG